MGDSLCTPCNLYLFKPYLFFRWHFQPRRRLRLYRPHLWKILFVSSWPKLKWMPTGPKPVCSNVDSILNRPSVHSKLHIRRAKSLKKRISNPIKSEKAPAVIVHSYVTISIEFILKVPITFLPFSCRIINTDYEELPVVDFILYCFWSLTKILVPRMHPALTM